MQCPECDGWEYFCACCGVWVCGKCQSWACPHLTVGAVVGEPQQDYRQRAEERGRRWRLRMRERKRNAARSGAARYGFTLVELLIVCAVIAILVGVSFAGYQAAQHYGVRKVGAAGQAYSRIAQEFEELRQ